MEPAGAQEEQVTNDDERVHNTTTTQPEPTTQPATGGVGGEGDGKGKLKAGAKGKGKGKGKDAATAHCANCGEEGGVRCTGCGMVHYCRNNIVIKNGKPINMCQQVSRPHVLCTHTHVHARAVLLIHSHD